MSQSSSTQEETITKKNTEELLVTPNLISEQKISTTKTTQQPNSPTDYNERLHLMIKSALENPKNFKIFVKAIHKIFKESELLHTIIIDEQIIQKHLPERIGVITLYQIFEEAENDNDLLFNLLNSLADEQKENALQKLGVKSLTEIFEKQAQKDPDFLFSLLQPLSDAQKENAFQKLYNNKNPIIQGVLLLFCCGLGLIALFEVSKGIQKPFFFSFLCGGIVFMLRVFGSPTMQTPEKKAAYVGNSIIFSIIATCIVLILLMFQIIK